MRKQPKTNRLFIEELESREVLSTFYVATTGSDSAAGTQAAPWLTLSHALSSVASGDTIDLRGGTYAGNVRVSTSNITLQSFPGEHAIVSSPTNNSSEGIVIWVEGDGFTLNDVEVTGGFYYGIKFELGLADGGTVENCKIHDTGDDACKVQTNNMTFLNDEIYNTGVTLPTSDPNGVDDVNGNNLHIVQCYFHDITNAAAFYAKGGVTGSLFERNLVVNCQVGLIIGGDTDTNLITTTNNPNLYENIGGVARNNIIVNTALAGIALWAADNASVYNNTLINVAETGQAGIFIRNVAHTTIDTPSTNVTIINNIVSISPTGGFYLFDIHNSGGNTGLTGTLTLANNLYFAGTGSTVWQDDRNGETAKSLSAWQSYLTSIGAISNDSKSLVGDPLFNTSTNHIASNSPAINAGLTIASFSNDYYGTLRPQGTAWDIGAEEYVSTLAGTATHFSVTAPVSVTAGSAFSITITALDANNNTATGYTGTIHFTSTDGASLLPADYTFTAGDAGVHTFTNATTLKTAGGKSVTTTDKATSSITGNASVTVNPAGASNFLLSGFPSSTTAGVAQNFTVTARDAFGNTATGYTGTITLSSTDAKGVLPANYTFASADAGIHAFSATLKTAGTQTLSAKDTVTNSITGSQSGITVNPAGANSFLVSGFPSSTTAGVAQNFAVTSLDAYGNTATGYLGTISFSSTDTRGALPANYTFSSADGGIHSFSATLRTAGSQSLTAKDTIAISISGSQTSITVSAAAANHLVLSRFPSITTAGVSQSFRVTVQDLYANTVASYTGTVTFSSSDIHALLPTNYSFTSVDAGVHTFSAALTTAGSQSLSAKDSANTSIAGGLSGIMVKAAATSQLQVTGFPLSLLPGGSGNFTVTAQDAFGNTTTAYTGTVKFTSSDLLAILPANYTFANADAGVHTFSATLKTAGVQSISATDTVNAALTGTESGITVVSVQPTAGLSGSSASVPGQPLNYNLNASESGLGSSTVYSYSVQWGDGSPMQTLSGPSGTQASHAYPVIGSYAVTLTATDPSGNASVPVSIPVTVSTVLLETDPYNSSLTALYVGGTTGNDTIAVTPVAGNGIALGMNFVNYGSFFPTGHVVVYGQSGNDIIKTAAQSIGGVLTYVNVPALFFAGNGTDILNVMGSIANNVLVGSSGSDRLIGGRGRDILIGGSGLSTLNAGTGDDILIGGTTSYDNNAAALAAILAEWSSADDYVTRIARITGSMTGGANAGYLLNSSTVLDDKMANNLYGGAGQDWYFAGLLDVLFNQTSGEIITKV